MTSHEPAASTLPLSVLDFVGIEHGESPHDALVGAIGIAQAVEGAGFRRYWVSEHQRGQNPTARHISNSRRCARSQKFEHGGGDVAGCGDWTLVALPLDAPLGRVGKQLAEPVDSAPVVRLGFAAPKQ